MKNDGSHNVVVFAPTIALTVTVEKGTENGAEVHFHPGGQGFWVARMLRHLGERPLLCGPVGGESGGVIRGLLDQWGINLSPVRVAGNSPVVVQDRRSGDRRVIAETEFSHLSRHELDDLYGTFLDHALSISTCVVSGQRENMLPPETYRRLGHDLDTAKVKVIGDFHGKELDSFLEGGAIDVLKVSHEDLHLDGLITEEEDTTQALGAIDGLVERGAGHVVVSLAGGGALAHWEGARYRVRPPEFEPADHRGAGDSMTAGLAAASIRGLGVEDTLALACAAGAANVTRHGLGSASERLIEELAERVEIEKLMGESN
jgi:1-phosphofructokinase